ncbi:MAG: serine/threonine-protein kinase [Planctomycetota bacterium]|nr:serine/threonine-protein kinase [Planctomycetota bacterium]
MPAKVLLEVTSGPIKGKVFPFESHDTFLFGRHGTCHAQIPRDGFVSRHHFILEVNPPDARLRDLGSLGGTYVNGTKYGGRAVDKAPGDATGRQFANVDLSDGDIIAVGKTTLRVKIEAPLQCCQCGTEILEDRVKAEWMPGSFMCRNCRGQLSTDAQSFPPRPVTVREAPRCDQCGQDVSKEVGSRTSDNYVCQECRKRLLSESGGLRRLMQDAAKTIQRDQQPLISGYELGEVLGKGGMGLVYKATRRSDGQTVAIKMMLPAVAVNEASREVFQREIGVTDCLDHANIVKLFEHGDGNGVFYFVCEFCKGGSLDQLMRRQGGRVTLKMSAPIMKQCLNGLEYAHSEGIVHRDLKPQNILLYQSDKKWTAKVADFGLAKSFETAGLSGMTATRSVGGTFHFMPREQLTDFKYVKPVSDIWSIAAAFYNVLTGQYPRNLTKDRDPIEVILHDEAIPIRDRCAEIPRAVAEVLDRALSSDTAVRFQSAAEFKRALDEAL